MPQAPLAVLPDTGSQLQAPGTRGMMPLLLASGAWRYHETIVFLLKNHGVDAGRRDAQGRTALSHVAENLGHFSDDGVASMLIKEYGKDPPAANADGLAPLAYFFLVCRDSKYMYCYRMRDPYSGSRRKAVSMEDSLQYHREAQEAMQMTLDRPDVLPDVPDREGKKPLWHALECAREHATPSPRAAGSADGGHFFGFPQSSIEALCARDDVDRLWPDGLGEMPFDLAAGERWRTPE